MSLIGRDGPRIAAELRAEQAEADAEHWRSEAMRHVDRIGVIEQQLQGAVSRADEAEARLRAIRGYLDWMDSTDDAERIRLLLDTPVGGQ